MKKFAAYFIIFVTFNTLVIFNSEARSHIVTGVEITGPITPVQEEILSKSLQLAEQNQSIMILIRLDTPGGTLSSARNMIKTILNSNLPAAVWVGPAGARAASAGVFLVAASDFSGMAPQTTIGSASPVDVRGKDTEKTMRKKIVHELTSLLRALGRDKGRNIKWYEESVTGSANLNAQEAVMNKVIEYIAVDEKDLLQQIGTDGLVIDGKNLRFSAKDIQIEQFNPGLKQKILSWIVNPQIAYLLFLAGILGFFFEFSTPGAIFPGVFGAVCLILALYSFSVLPISAAGILLILTGFIFFLLELKITSFGLLGLGASASIFLGSLMLFDSAATGISVPLKIIIPAVLTIILFFLIIVYLVGKAQISPKKQEEQMLGLNGEIITWENGQGKIKLRGEIWNCTEFRKGTKFNPGDSARVAEQSGLTLKVIPNE